ncbi:phosphatase PAP2 family protein [Streptomyces violascens]|uniref:Phosphatase PAP2 family protein n=1 Tax=Streptomyces violascens TaxID=67381 RepID=A0ABQ3QFN6_9ACTN|nr:phosphatase PAP2 family protein [Streptomyces violascens]GGT87178.1 phosphatase PAP2 family protein [Streptomyces violascens]GHI36050.1 phosphatase PAP2 family protein [Streptomyces violascens]
MTSSTPTPQALDGASIDGGLYGDITDFARHTHWLNGPVSAFTSYGIALFAVLMLAGWWIARRKDASVMAAALAAPVAMVLAYVVNDGIKSVFTEPRPCRALPHDFLIEKCPPLDDYAFPSNHTTVAAAAAVALFLVNRRLGIVASVFALLMGASRVYVGAHYPHDVLVALVVGGVVSFAVTWSARRFGAPLVTRLRGGALRPLLA